MTQTERDAAIKLVITLNEQMDTITKLMVDLMKAHDGQPGCLYVPPATLFASIGACATSASGYGKILALILHEKNGPLEGWQLIPMGT